MFLDGVVEHMGKIEEVCCEFTCYALKSRHYLIGERR